MKETNIDQIKILEIFRKYGLVSEKPIDIKQFIKDISNAVKNQGD
jgi:hypothetical protein